MFWYVQKCSPIPKLVIEIILIQVELLKFHFLFLQEGGVAMKNKRIEMGNWVFEFNPHTPLGFVQSVEVPAMLRPYEKHVTVVRKIFQLCINGWSLGQIAQYVDSAGISYRAKYEKPETVKWSTAEIKKILQNEIYVNGNYRVVSKRQYEIAQRMMEINTRATGANYIVSPLVGLAKCSECGHYFVERVKSSRGKKYHYYMCGLNKRNGECTTHQITTGELDGRVLTWLKNHVFEEEIQRALKLTREMAIRYVDWVIFSEQDMFKIVLK